MISGIGPYGVLIDDYKLEWEHSDDIDWKF
jgi:hypothetical protein